MNITRFPPEPNGYLHIGHTKSIFINWRDENCCHLRLDDTNPDSEKKEFVENIIDDLEWLGICPGNITYTSDYFDILYEYAILLINNDLAYVDFTPKDRIKEERKCGIENNYRNENKEKNLENFEKMKNGYYKNSECVLRLKIDMNNVNYTLRDPVAYRISFTPHYRLETKWCIYPSYDYSHSIVDAIENITHSYCTDEFYIRRDLYYWTINKLIELGVDLKPAQVVEYGKLSIKNNILSKRNINRLVSDGLVSGYDDPRLLTIKGLKRRGFTPSVIKEIVKCSGFNKHETVVDSNYVEHLLRLELNESAIRVFGILDPLKVFIKNINEFEKKECIHPNHPVLDYGTHTNYISDIIYIEKNDFKKEHDKNYYRYTPENYVRLKYSDFTKLVSYTDELLTIQKMDPPNPKKVKGCIHWISEKDAIPAIFELYTDLAPNGIFDSNSKKIKDGFIEKYVMDNLNKVFQFERIGFFKFDRYENNKPVFIKITGLLIT